MTTGNCLNVTVAQTDKEKEEGLRPFKNLSANEGMIFVYPEPVQIAFWNLGVNYDVALLYVSSDMRVKNISIMKAQSTEANFSLTSYKYYIEVKPETLVNLSIKAGSMIVDILDS